MAHDHPNIAVAVVLIVYMGLCLTTTGKLRVFVMAFGALVAVAVIFVISLAASLDFK